MKKIFLGIIIGGVIFGSLGVLAGSYNAKQISFTPNDATWNVKHVETALDNIKQEDKTQIANLQSAVSNKQSVIDQYSGYSLYTGSTTFTPTTSSQTISTKDKMLNSNITINAIPSKYTNLSFGTPQYAEDLSPSTGTNKTVSLSLSKGRYIILRSYVLAGAPGVTGTSSSYSIGSNLSCSDNACTIKVISSRGYTLWDTQKFNNTYMNGYNNVHAYYVEVSKSTTVSTSQAVDNYPMNPTALVLHATKISD